MKRKPIKNDMIFGILEKRDVAKPLLYQKIHRLDAKISEELGFYGPDFWIMRVIIRIKNHA